MQKQSKSLCWGYIPANSDAQFTNPERILCFPHYLIKIAARRVAEDPNGCQRRGGGGGKEEEQETPTAIPVWATFIESSVTEICQKYSEITRAMLKEDCLQT